MNDSRTKFVSRERWKAYNEDYLISSLGRWYSLRHQKILNQKCNNKGYMRLEGILNGKRKNFFTHIAVVEKFGDKYGNRIPKGATSLIALGLSIDHINMNKNDNSRSNLELVTHQENCKRRSLAYAKNKKEKKN